MSYTPNPMLESILKKKLQAALSNAGDVLLDKVKSNAPVDSGKLRQSLKKSDIGDLKIKIETDVDYASAVEFGTFKQAPKPFMRPALKSSKNKMLKKFKDII